MQAKPPLLSAQVKPLAAPSMAAAAAAAASALSDSLENLLVRMAGGDSAKVQVLVNALGKAGLQRGSELLAATVTARDREELQEHVADDAEEEGCELPRHFMASLRVAVQDSRLAFSGFPSPPPWTSAAVLFSAPHSLRLPREGHRHHIPEAYTSHLARDFAQIVGGAFLTWSQREEARVRELHRAVGEPDPTNQDPNYTHVDDAPESAWARNLQEVRGLFGPGRRCLHVDLHGCKDPGTDGGSHLVVGLRAMEFAHRSGVEELRTALLATLSFALRGISINARPLRQLTGAWDNDRRTLSQQSLSEAGGAWTQAVQLEMSRCLRNRLARSRVLRSMVARAIVLAWLLSADDTEEPDAIWAEALAGMRLWQAQCRKFYERRHSALEEDSSCSRSGGAGRGADAEDLEEERVEGSGGTANNEVPEAVMPPPLPELEKDLLLRAGRLERRFEEARLLRLRAAALGLAPVGGAEQGGRAAASTTALSPTSMPVAVLREWLQQPLWMSLPAETEVVPSGPSKEPRDARRIYHIAGTWSDFKPVEMRLDAGLRFVHFVTIGQNGWESFQLLLGGSWDSAIYPSTADANPFVEHTLEGPDNRGHGRNWTIGQPDPKRKCDARNSAEAGARYRILVLLNDSWAAWRVNWELTSPGSVAVSSSSGSMRLPPTVGAR